MGFERYYLRRPQWAEMARRAEEIRPGKDALQSLGALERQQHLRPHDGRLGDTASAVAQDKHDRRDQSQSQIMLHAVTSANGRPISFFMTAGQISDYSGAAALLDSLPKAQWMLGERSYVADWFRDALQEKGHHALHPGPEIRNKTGKYHRRRYRGRNRIEIMFGRIEDWRRVATRYDR